MRHPGPGARWQNFRDQGANLCLVWLELDAHAFEKLK